MYSLGLGPFNTDVNLELTLGTAEAHSFRTRATILGAGPRKTERTSASRCKLPQITLRRDHTDR